MYNWDASSGFILDSAVTSIDRVTHTQILKRIAVASALSHFLFLNLLVVS